MIKDVVIPKNQPHSLGAQTGIVAGTPWQQNPNILRTEKISVGFWFT
jgi:hypothetical protein